jgi:hypothetical protein
MITGITKHFMFHILWISILRFLYFNFFSASFCIKYYYYYYFLLSLPAALRFLQKLDRPFSKFLNLVSQHLIGFFRRWFDPSRGLYLHRTAHGKTRKNIHALSGIRTHNPWNPRGQYTLDRAAFGTHFIAKLKFGIYANNDTHNGSASQHI